MGFSVVATGCDQCHFCSSKESVEHLLFQCSVSRFLWHVVLCALGFSRALNDSTDLFGAWYSSFPGSQRKLMLVGAAAVAWTIWRTRNNACFGQQMPSDPSAIIFSLCNTLISWNILQKESKRRILEAGVHKIRRVVEEAYS
ncbi:hypothetical protein BRADI_2g35455v3 [Brachypodium distachyon]|uniref:Reverse transcriptase zinc-binding domain-containing protein n=1 Tax=Brachypodium distachyon TaxID=15368 RepID=A0A2K2DBV6_BRADI|nr:hypothetical protein BRADI_2g35455v3 [Brachypodium distachyon]